ncbi:MAG TPA: hypothetical protein VHR86_06150, partial [Armatimonadota bacterium]|nr:hypothetical protein [Armatimonadota bacterium]
MLEEPELLRGTTNAHSLVTYKQGEKLLAASLYAFGSDKGSDYILMTFAPREEMRNYISLFDRMADSVKLNRVETAKVAEATAEPKTPVVAQETAGQVTVARRTKLHPLYWIRDGKRVVRDGKPLFLDSAGIQRARVSWGGKYILYVRNDYKDLVLVNLSTL